MTTSMDLKDFVLKFSRLPKEQQMIAKAFIDGMKAAAEIQNNAITADDGDMQNQE